MTNEVSVVKTASYDQWEMCRAVRQHFEELEIPSLVYPGMKVVLKPNLLMKRKPEEGTTTHPSLVKAVALELKELGITDVVIADSPGGPYTRQMIGPIYAASGMEEAARETGARLNRDFDWQVVRGREGAMCREWSIIKPIVEADLVINLAKLKTHAMTTLSGGVKNLFGCVPGLQKPQMHFRFPQKELFGQMLVELAELVNPALTIVDAVVSMEGDGPSAGELRETGMTFAARNVFALDRALCDFICLPTETVPMVHYAVERGLCPRDTADIAYLSDGRPQPVEDYRHPASKTLVFSRHMPGWLRRRLSPRPVIRRSGCIGCGKCAESCAPEAVRLRRKKAFIDYSRCISCYCCHEMCPVKTIGIRRTPLSF